MIIILIHYRLHYISDCCTSLTWSPFTIHDMNGCSRQCCQNTHNLSVLDIMQYRAYFNELPKNAKCKWILDFIATHSSYQAASKLPDISYTICGKKVCQNVWIATLGISSSFFYCIRKKFLNGSVAIIKEPSRSPSQKNAEGNSMDTKLCRLTWRPPATQNDCSFAQQLNESWHISQNGG